MLVHFKSEFCGRLQTTLGEVTDKVFPDPNRFLVVLHKGKHENPHWHFQGETDLEPKDLDAYLKTLMATHSKRDVSEKSRPIKRAKKSIDDTGYQYMMKEATPSVVASRGFTPEELDELHEASAEHVQALKDTLLNYFEDNLDFKLDADERATGPKIIHNRARSAAFKYYMTEKKMFPPNLQKLISYNVSRMVFDGTDERFKKTWERYIRDKI